MTKNVQKNEIEEPKTYAEGKSDGQFFLKFAVSNDESRLVDLVVEEVEGIISLPHGNAQLPEEEAEYCINETLDRLKSTDNIYKNKKFIAIFGSSLLSLLKTAVLLAVLYVVLMQFLVVFKILALIVIGFFVIGRIFVVINFATIPKKYENNLDLFEINGREQVIEKLRMKWDIFARHDLGTINDLEKKYRKTSYIEVYSKDSYDLIDRKTKEKMVFPHIQAKPEQG